MAERETEKETDRKVDYISTSRSTSVSVSSSTDSEPDGSHDTCPQHPCVRLASASFDCERTFEEMKRLAFGDTGRMWRLVSVLWFLGGFGVRGKEVFWEIQVYTSSVRNAGTDADVRIILFGNEGRSQSFLLDNRENNFERGMLDTFEVVTADIGELCKVHISHDNSGSNPGWHLDKIVIWSKSYSRKRYYFLCNCWLARDEGYGRIDRIIYATSKCREGWNTKRRGIMEQRARLTSNGKEFQSSKRSAFEKEQVDVNRLLGEHRE